MAFNAGEVVVLLGGRLDPSGFRAFDAQMKSSVGRAGAFERSMRQSMASGQKSLDTFGRVAKTTAKVGLFGLGAGLVYAVKKAADFEQQLDRLGAASGANAKQMAALKKQAMESGAATKFSALEAAAAQTELAKGGLSAATILKGGLNGALALAAAGELELADAATYTVNALKLFKMTGQDAGHVADALATAANTTTADVKDFGAALVQGGGAARSAGYDFDQTVTILEALAEVGVKNSDAGTSMKTALLQLVGPTQKQADTAQAAGLAFLNTEGRMKSLSSISGMLRAKTEDMTAAQRTALFQTLAGTDGFRTLLALYDAGPGKLKRLEKGLQEQGTAAETAKKKQDNLKGALETLGGSVETAAITVGTALIPMIREGAENLTDFINEAQKSGDIEDFAEGLVDGIKDVVQFAGDAANAIGDIVDAGADAASALAPVAGVLDDLIPGDLAHNLAGAAAGLVAFKGASAVAAGIASLASPMGAARLAAIGLGIAIVGMMDKERADIAVSKGLADAKREQADAIQAAQDAIAASADTGLAEERAELNYDQQVAALGKLTKGTKAYHDQQLAVREASLDLEQARTANTKAIDNETETLRKNVDASQQRRDDLRKMIAGLEFAQEKTGHSAEITKALAAAQEGLNNLNGDYIRNLAMQATAETSRQRLMERSTQITAKNAEGVAELIEQFGEVPASQQSKLLLDNQDALAEAGQLSRVLNKLGQQKVVAQILANAQSATSVVHAFKAVLAGVPAKTVAKILADANSARAETLAFKALLAGVPASKITRIVAHSSGQAEINALKAAIDSLQSKSITITTTHYNRVINSTSGGVSGKATGRAAGGRELAEVGEGKNPREYVIDRRTGEGYITGGPMLTELGPDQYVIPTDTDYRGRALGLVRSLLSDLGVRGYKKGRKVPPRIATGGVPFSDVQSDFEKARDNLGSAKDDQKRKDKAVEQAARANARAEEKATRSGLSKTEKASADHEAKRAFRELGKANSAAKRAADKVKRLEPILATRKQDFEKARETNDKVLNLQSEINVLRDQMELADRANNTGLFNQLKAVRGTKLGRLAKLLAKAQKYAKGENLRALNERLSQLGIDITDNAADVDETSAAGAFTADEQARLDDLDAKLALAELTDAIEGPGEDRDILTQIETTAAGALERVRVGGTPAQIREAAEAVKSARDRIKGLSTGGGGDQSTADLQAQLDQERERTRVATLERDLNAAAVTAFGPSRARDAAPQIVINQNNLHPGDSRTLVAVGDAAAAGWSHRSTRTSPRSRVL